MKLCLLDTTAAPGSKPAMALRFEAAARSCPIRWATAGPVVGAAGNRVLRRCLHGAGGSDRKLLAVLRMSNPVTKATLDTLARAGRPSCWLNRLGPARSSGKRETV